MNLVYTFWEVTAPVEKLKQVKDFLDRYENRKPRLLYQIAEENTFFPHTRYCGEIIDFVWANGKIFIDEESNRPQIEFVESLLNHFMPDKDYKLEYISESDDNGEFFTNKGVYKGKYKLDGEIPELELPELDHLDPYCLNEEGLKNILGCIFKKKHASLSDLLGVFENREYYYDLSIHKWDYITLSELKGE